MSKLLGIGLTMLAAASHAASWEEITEAANGQTVYWNAWGGDVRTNSYIDWVSEQTQAEYGVTIKQVKLTDTAEAVNRVIAEKAAGQDIDGSVDLIWINGPNFDTMKHNDLLFGPFVQDLPNAKYVDLSPDAAASLDFTIPVEGMEAPWRLAKFVFFYDHIKIENPPRSMAELANWAVENPGRVTHPNPTDFMGATFLKQALIESMDNPKLLQAEATPEDFTTLTQNFWQWYDAIRPNLWQGGKNFPENQFALQTLVNDGQVDFGVSFDPGSTAAAIKEGILPDTMRVMIPKNGSIGNISFVAIPYNAANKEGAMVVANMLLSPEAQSHMQNIDVLGSFAVLDYDKLGMIEQGLFDELPRHPALPGLDHLGPILNEPHPSWMTMLTEEWLKRYGG